MSARVVAVPGVGNVEFPDSMSHDDISSVIKQHVASAASAAGSAVAETGNMVGSQLESAYNVVRAPWASAGSAVGTVLGGGSIADAYTAAKNAPPTRVAGAAAADAGKTFKSWMGINPNADHDVADAVGQAIPQAIAAALGIRSARGIAPSSWNPEMTVMPSSDPLPPSGTRMRPYQTQQLAKKIAVRNGWNIASIGDRNGGAAIPDETMPARVKQLGDEARAVPRIGDAILQAFQKAGAQ